MSGILKTVFLTGNPDRSILVTCSFQIVKSLLDDIKGFLELLALVGNNRAKSIRLAVQLNFFYNFLYNKRI